jgi:hypothetical protein
MGFVLLTLTYHPTFHTQHADAMKAGTPIGPIGVLSDAEFVCAVQVENDDDANQHGVFTSAGCAGSAQQR